MNEATTAETVAALWFTVVFGLALLVPVFRAPCKAARSVIKRRQDNDAEI